jgi:hypothetical protein
MLLGLLVGSLVTYRFRALDFIPNDLNDKGWIVGETRVPQDYGFRKSAVLLRDCRKIDLGAYGDTGSAVRINNLGHVLIECDPSAVPKSKPSKGKRPLWGSAYLFWANGKATYVGEFRIQGSFLNSGRFLAEKRDGILIVTMRNRKASFRLLPAVPSRYGGPHAGVHYRDLNEHGTLVGSTELGGSWSHAIQVDSRGRLTDLYPKVEMHTGWTASRINARGDILGYYTYDSSIGGGSNVIWRSGKVRFLPPIGLNGLTTQAVSLNDRSQMVGAVSLYASGSAVQAFHNAESVAPYTATATSHAVLWNDDQLINLNDVTDKPENCVLASATKINNQGWIIGTAVREGKRIGFLLTPTSDR